MGDTLKRADYLSLLGSTRQKKKRELLIDFASSKDIRAVLEIVYNLLYGDIPLSTIQRRTLRKYQSTLRQIVSRKASLQQKRQILKQDGGFLPTLIPIALSVLSSLVK